MANQRILKDREKSRQHEAKQREEDRKHNLGSTLLGNPDLLEDAGNARFLEALGDFDIGREEFEDDLDEELATELSRLLQFGYITRQDWEEFCERNDIKADQLKAEHPQMTGASSKCKGRVRRIMLGGGDQRPELTPEVERRYDSAMDARDFGMSNSIEGRGLDAVAQIQAAIESFDESKDEGGNGSVLSRARSLLSRGGS